MNIQFVFLIPSPQFPSVYCNLIPPYHIVCPLELYQVKCHMNILLPFNKNIINLKNEAKFLIIFLEVDLCVWNYNWI